MRTIIEPTEEMRPVPGYEGRYSVTSDGRVWSHPKEARGSNGSVRMVGGRWLRPGICHGYPQVALSNGKRMKTIYVHRLVASAWPVRVTMPGNDVNHINGNKLDNRVENLEWCNRSHNIRHALHTGLKPITEKMLAHTRSMGKSTRKLTFEDVAAMKAARATGRTVQSIATEYGLAKGTTSLILNGKSYINP